MYQAFLKKSRSDFICFALSVSFVFVLFSGCKDSSDSAKQKRISEGVSQSQSLIRGSGQEINMTGAELAEVGPGSARRLAKAVVDRRERSAGLSGFDAVFAEIDQLRGQLQASDRNQLGQISERLLSAGRNLLAGQAAMDELSDSAGQKRLDLARQSLRSAIAEGKQLQPDDSVRQSLAAAELVIGTLDLIEARRQRNLLSRQDSLIQRMDLELGRLSIPIWKELAAEYELQSYLPDDAIAKLRGELQGPTADGSLPLKEQLVRTRQTAERLLIERSRLQREFDEYSAKAARLQRQYLGHLALAEKARGPERFAMEQMAYDLRSGVSDGGGDDAEEGGLYAELRAELAASELTALDSRLMVEQLRLSQLTERVSDLSELIDQISQSPTIELVASSTAAGRDSRAAKVKQLETHLDAIIKAESDYSKMRIAAVDAYTSASSVYAASGRTAMNNTSLRSYSQKLSASAGFELGGLWLTDAGHYARSAELLGLVGDISEISDRLGTIVREHSDAAAQARSSALELLPKEPEEPEPSNEAAVDMEADFDVDTAVMPAATAVPVTVPAAQPDF